MVFDKIRQSIFQVDSAADPTLAKACHNDHDLTRHVDQAARSYAAVDTILLELFDAMTIRVSTKVPVANILQLASLAYRTLPIPAAVGDTMLETDHPAMDWLVVLVITQIDALVRRGLRQDYVIVEDELPYVRGR